jgi:hypothetical protein
VYDFPVWLRKFYIRKINEAIEAENNANKPASKNTPPKIERPNFRTQ